MYKLGDTVLSLDNDMKRLLVITLISGLFFSCATSEGSLFETVIGAETGTDAADQPAEKQDSVDEPTTKSDAAPADPDYGIKISTNPVSAMIFLNGSLVGAGSVLVSPEPGSYQVTARKQGYYSESVWVTYQDETLVIVELDLEEITGYLFIDVEPADAEITINGHGATKGVTELQIGSYSIRVREFGYEEWQRSVSIQEQRTTEVRVELEEAAFRLSDLATSRRVFSPKNPGKLGTTRVTFDVSSWGEGRFIVWDQAGTEVVSRELPRFDTWEQSTDWDGRDLAGSPVPDGEYRVGIEARGRESSAIESTWVIVTIDSDAVISFRGFLTGLSGTYFAPTPDILPSRSFQIDVGFMGHFDPDLGVGRYPSYVTVRSGLGGNSEIDLQGSLFIQPSSATPYSVGLGFKYRLPEPDSSPFSLGLTGKLTYVGNTSHDTFTNYTGLGFGLTGQLQTGPISFVVSPEVVVSPYTVSYSDSPPAAALDAWLYGRAGVLADFGSITADLSGAIRTVPFSSGFAIDLPFSAGIAVHWLIPGTQIVVSGYATGEAAALDNFYIMGGGSIGIIN